MPGWLHSTIQVIEVVGAYLLVRWCEDWWKAKRETKRKAREDAQIRAWYATHPNVLHEDD